MATSLTTDQQLLLTVHGVDASGGTVTVFGSTPAWSVHASAGVVNASSDGLSATFVPSVAGEATITVSALAKPGDTEPLTATVTLTVTASGVGVAVSLIITPGDPQPKAS